MKWHENIYNDEEYTFQLNRMEHWRIMAEAYSFTGNKKFALKIIEEFYHWVDECPCPSLFNFEEQCIVDEFDGRKCREIWRPLEIGIRMYRTWPHIIHHLMDSGLIDEKFLETYLNSIYLHAKILYLVTPKLWPNADHNHYLMENNGLLYLSCMFPEFEDAEIWKRHAICEMERCMDVQVTEDGGQIEGCASYHNGSIYWFTLPVLLADKYCFVMSDKYKERLRKMMKYSVHATRPCGGNCSWGDSHTYKETMVLGATSYYLAFKDDSYMQNALCYYSVKELMDAMAEHIWEVDDLQDLEGRINGIAEKKCLPLGSNVNWQKKLKQVFMRTDWSSNALYVMFACRTPIQNLHAHMDPAGFEFCAYGRVLLGDPAIYHYKDDEIRKNMKSAHWHNCLTINYENPWKYISSWAYGEQKPGDILNMDQNDRLIYALAEHRNYEPIIHKRAVAIVDKKFLVVIDILDGVLYDTSVQINFHIDSHMVTADSENSFVVSVDSRSNIIIYTDNRLKPTLIPAKISTQNDVWHDTMVARFEVNHLTGEKHAFLSIAYPIPISESVPEVSEISQTFLSDGKIQFCFMVEQNRYELSVFENELIVRSE